jgi:formylglycine-generating enzyme required for sulfatase activity
MRTLSLAAAALLACASSQAAPPDAAIDWVKVPGGSFLMGSNEWSQTKPVHKVTVKPFELARTPVTNKQYRACVEAKACAPVKECAAPQGDDLPATCVDWDQAAAFARWAGARLPSDAEWEFAARDAGAKKAYPWGKFEPAIKPVCKSGDKTALGLCDMGGLWEWVQDWHHGSYAGAPRDGSAWDDAGWDRVYVGGGFYFKNEGKLTSPCRNLAPADRRPVLGFRVARS